MAKGSSVVEALAKASQGLEYSKRPADHVLDRASRQPNQRRTKHTRGQRRVKGGSPLIAVDQQAAA
jgi:hypothetical protein